MLIDRRFQLRTTFSIIGVIIIALIALIAVTGIIMNDNNRRIMTAMHALTAESAAGTTAKVATDPAAATGPDAATGTATVDLMITLVQRNRMIVAIMIVMTMVLGAFLSFYLIRLTHRISGPIYVISQIMHDVMEGRTPDTRPLRKNDEFQEFYGQFTEMVRRIKKPR
jgi:HAMP domain-containing protein